MNIIPGTVCCLLCRGMVIYKDGDKTRFRAHMNNEHGAFFDIDYLLASCLLEKDQKEAVAKTVKVQDKVPAMLEENNVHDGVTLRESSFNRPSAEIEANAEKFLLKKEKEDCPEDPDFQNTSIGAQLGTTYESSQQLQGRGGKKEKLKRKYVRKEKVNNEETNTIKRESYDDPKMNPNLMFQRYPEDTPETQVSNRYSYDVGNPGDSGVYAAYYNRDNSDDYDSNTKHDTYQGNETGNYRNNYDTHETTGNQSRDDDLNKILHEATRQDPGYVNQVLNEARSRNPMEFDQTINRSSYAKKRSADDLDEMLDEARDQSEVMHENEESGVSVEKSTSVVNASERFYCQVEGCGKSYTVKSNKQIHEKKAHGILSTRSKNKKFKMSTEEPEPRNHNGEPEVKEKESIVQWEELKKIRAQYYNSPTRKANSEASETREQVPGGDDGVQLNVDATLSHSFSPDVSNDLGDGETSAEEQFTNKTVLDGVDISQSRYFKKNPKSITSARGKSVALFTETPSGLPANWKMRSVETTNKAGGKIVTRHFLSPELKVLKTGLSVVEYLRLKGELDTDQILEISRVLNISESKLKSLY